MLGLGRLEAERGGRGRGVGSCARFGVFECELGHGFRGIPARLGLISFVKAVLADRIAAVTAKPAEV